MRAIILAAVVLAWCGPARAEHPMSEMGLHNRFYSTWMMPDAPHVSCCGDGDCHPAASRFVGGHWEARWSDDEPWTPIPPNKVEQNRETPDGRSHMCGRKYFGSVTVFCFVRGGGV